MKKILKSQWLAAALFLVLAVLVLYSLISQFRSVPVVDWQGDAGTTDLTDFDFELYSTVIHSAEYYPDMLLLPSEIDRHLHSSQYEFDRNADYHTIRSKILVPDGIYLIYETSPEYASRFYINGVLTDEYGYVDLSGLGNNRYRVAPMNIAAVPADGVIEVVIHTAGIVRDDARYLGFTFGAYETVKNEPMYHIISRLMPVVLTLAFALFHFGHFLFTPGYRENLWFALIALSSALLLTPADALFPAMSYELEYRAVRMSITFICIFYSLFIRELYGVSKKIPVIVCSLGAVIILLQLTLPVSIIAKTLMIHNVYIFSVMSVCIVCIALRLRHFKAEQYISFGAQIIFMICGVFDSLGVRNIFNIPLLTFGGITIFLFAQMLALYLVNNRAIENEQRLAAENVSLEKLNTAKTELLGNISHEFKTPLTVISNVSQLTAKRTDDEYIQEKMDIAVSEVERMKTKVGQLLKVARLDDPDTDWSFKPTDIEELVNEVIYTYFSAINEYGNIISTDISHDLPPVKADTAYLRGVIVNLLENAMRFTRNGQIKICAGQDGGFINVSVTDTGSGMSEEEMEGIFEKFYTGKKSTGTGLGLYICKKTIEAHGGEISFESKPGAGTTVRFTLPVFCDEAAGVL